MSDLRAEFPEVSEEEWQKNKLQDAICHQKQKKQEEMLQDPYWTTPAAFLEPGAKPTAEFAPNPQSNADPSDDSEPDWEQIDRETRSDG